MYLFIICAIMMNLALAEEQSSSAPSKTTNAAPANASSSTTAADQEYQNSTPAISRYGKPRYGTDDTHFAYCNPGAPKGGNLELAQLGTFDNLFISSYIGTKAVKLELTHSRLLHRSKDEPFSLYGMVAERVYLAPDNSHITYFLNKKAKFHDGHPITADDIKFSFEKQRDEGRPAQRRFYGMIDRIEIKDQHTITLHFKRDEKTNRHDAELPFIVSLMYVLPKHQLENKALKDLGMTVIIGSGPYKIDSHEQGRFIKYRRVENHWAGNTLAYKGQHNFDTIRYTYYKNKQSMVQAIMSGDVHFHKEDDIKTWRSNLSGPAVTDGRLVKTEREHNLQVPVRTIIFNMHEDVFANKLTRKALVYAFDFNTMNKLLFNNSFHRMTTLFPNTGLGFSGPASEAERQLLKPYMDKIDPAILESGLQLPDTPSNGTLGEAKQQVEDLLQQAGWVIKAGRRVHKETGKPLTFVFLVRDQYLEKIALMYKETLKKFFGIDIEVRKLSVVQYENMVINRQFGAIIHTWANTRSPGNEQSYYFSVEHADTNGSSNYIGVKKPMLEELAKQVSLARTEEELHDAVKAFDRVVMNEWLMIPLTYDNKQRFMYWREQMVMAEYRPDAGINPIRTSWAAPQQFKQQQAELKLKQQAGNTNDDQSQSGTFLDMAIGWINKKLS